MTAIALTLVLNSCTYIKLEDHHERYDLDGDGHIDMAMGGGDCNDDSDEVYPRATEICNQVDDDCDHTVDEGAGVRWYLDDDGDGYGRSDVHIKACDQPREDYVDDATDCDDSQEDVHPGAEEIWYDGTDQDCDMNDSDQDGDGQTLPGGDCDDENDAINSDATEICYDAWDSDCDGQNNNGCEGDLGTMSHAIFLGEAAEDMPNSVAMHSFEGQPRDLFIGAGSHDDPDGTENTENHGALYVFRDPVQSGTHSLAQADFKVTGEGHRHYFTHRMDMMDIDDDGIEELLVSARDANGVDDVEKGGKIYVFDPDDLVDGFELSQAQAVFLGHEENLQLGYEFAKVPRWDHNGTTALLATAPSLPEEGSMAFVFASSRDWSSEETSENADLVIQFDEPDTAGQAVAVGEFNGDGFTDFVLADPSGSLEGYASVVLGGVSGTVTEPDLWWTQESNNKFGVSVVGADLDSDGYDDLLIGASAARANDSEVAGQVYVVRGGPAMSSESSFAGRINGVVADGELGNDMRSLTLPSTKTDTGIPKDAVLIGAMGYSPPNTGSAGAVYLVLDASETLKSYNTNVSDMEHVLLGGAGSGENAGWNVRIDGIDDGGLPFLFVAARDKVDDEGTIVGGVYMASISNLIAE